MLPGRFVRNLTVSGRTNWAGNYKYRAAKLHRPESVEQVQEIVAASKKLKALGTRHSFNEVADTPGDQISTENLSRILSLDRDQRSVTIEGGVRYGELCLFLNERGFALQNLASLPHISVAGACATGTHGSGLGLGNLSTAVRALTLVTADGSTLHFDQNDRRFPGAVVGLGALGVVVELTLDVEPAYDMAQKVYENLPFSALEAHFEEIESLGYSVSLFTDWAARRLNQLWIKRRLTDQAGDCGPAGAHAEWPAEVFGAKAATENHHPIPGLSAVHSTDQLGIPGPWYERLPHFRLGFTPSSGEELQTEYLVAQADGIEAIRAVAGLADRISPLLQVCEIRTIAADELWMSPAYRRDSLAIHFTWRAMWPQVQALIPDIESALQPFQARPHWGKLFAMGHERVAGLYEKLPDFKALAGELDPAGKFRNDFLAKHLGF